MKTAAARRELVGLIKKSELDVELAKYADVCDQIKTLEAQKDRLKKALVKSYFESKATYSSKDGSINASYMPQNRTQFKNAEFKEAYPKLYTDFSYAQEVHVFTVKRSA